MKCRPYITQFLNEIATRIQSLGRMYLARKRVQKKRLLHQKKMKKLKNKRLKEKLSESSLTKPSDDLFRNTSTTSVGTEYSHRNETMIGSSLEGNSSIITDLHPGSLYQTSVESQKKKSSPSSRRGKVKPKSATPSMIRRMKETVTAYSLTTKKNSPRSAIQPPSSMSHTSLMDSSGHMSAELYDQVKHLKNDLSMAFNHHRSPSKDIELSHMKDIMTTVLSEIKALRQGNNNQFPSRGSTRSPLSENISDNQSNLKQNIDSMLSQISNIQKDLSEQKELSSTISLQLQEQNQVMISSLAKSEVSRKDSNLTNEIKQDEKEKNSLKLKTLEISLENSQLEIERLKQTLATRDREYQKEQLKSSMNRSNIQKEFHELKAQLQDLTDQLKDVTKNYEEKIKENDHLKQNISKLEKENVMKQQELRNHISLTVDKLQSTQQELEVSQSNADELNQSYQNALLKITYLQSQVAGMERQLTDVQDKTTNNLRHEIQRLETENFDLQQKLLESERKASIVEKSRVSEQEEIKKLVEEIAKYKLLLSQSENESSQKLATYYEVQELRQETQNLKSSIAEKENYISTLQAKFSELEIKVLIFEI